jgi:hypothetical protein
MHLSEFHLICMDRFSGWNKVFRRLIVEYS